ncbi:aldehyde dehydrogenase family protein [Conexibacter woesei]|uniref:Aldehyde Dehydrogenase n=1 Tax=Conexibacter woesei (strain DSM 14684 / CCUG 47730 / CIP 108061 / JCM 11494 / NBRC 100937 / ID131577) TaxID=469383 RepID=D3F6V5_CONWI|nr:aldehyde dehydrogenase family protein [Conexibacter woesei]ADB52753.1 Aldehyde Dehydrogenase [Conexibacter woesei DSM 14684]
MNGAELDLQLPDQPLLIDGEEVATGAWDEVRSPYDGALVGRVARASAGDVERAVRAAGAAFTAGELPLWQRIAVLERAAELVGARSQELARLIAREMGKPLAQARAEVERAEATLRFSVAAARTLGGELVPLDALAAGEGRIGMVMRVPLGVVAAITPFNFPLNLVAHKLGPALAAGNPVVLKPAPQAPLSGFALAAILRDAGLPPGWLHVVAGGADVGARLVADDDVAAVTFTGSTAVGWSIRASAPRKRVCLELGSTAPLIVDETGDWEDAADRAVLASFGQAGQSCVSLQRVLVHERVAGAFVERLLARTRALVVGDPLADETEVGPLIDAGQRDRVKRWIDAAVAAGATRACGGAVNPDGTLQPTVLVDPPADADVWRAEVFGPVLCVRSVASFADAIAQANDADYGLQAGVYTRDLGRALRAARQLEFGGVLVNDVPTTRFEHQPYGGGKDSGNTREGPAATLRELTEERFVALSTT